MKLAFLEHCFRWVIAEGVLVFGIPGNALGACARLLASQFERLSVFRLEHPESVRFKQIVVFGKRKKSHARGNPKGTDSLLRGSYHPNSIAALGQQVQERYSIPPSPPVTIQHIGLPLDAIEERCSVQRPCKMRGASSFASSKR